MSTLFLGIDTGGTFTDFVLWRDGRLLRHKRLSTPDAPERAILQGIAELGLQGLAFRLVHGSTVATNAVLEGKGVKTLFVTNRGFADMLTIGRQNRAALYDLQPHRRPPPVPPECCVETGGRLSARGELLEPLTEADIAHLLAVLKQQQAEAVAVNLLFSWQDGRFEQHIADALPEDVFVSLSSQVLPEVREYERGMATWLNAWVGPQVKGYLRRLGDGLPGIPVAVMQSSGETLDAAQAGGQAVRMLLSGPAGGLVAARFVARHSGHQRLLSFDMGGTSTDVALLDGEPALTREGRIGGYPVAVPMVDMHTIGAGGGSIAWLDQGGMLQVGPESAGASPGPACYGQGGTQPTVTDANLLLGRLPSAAALGGGLRLDQAAAEQAMARLASAMGMDVMAAARGVIRIANEHMARALRGISIERGVDPRGFALVSFGGAGGLHVCALAEALGMDEALVPVHGGVLSALGMLAARPGRQKTRSWLRPLDGVSPVDIDQALAELRDAALAELAAEGLGEADCETRYALDLRYQGQSATLELPWTDMPTLSAAFHQAHRARYGHAMEVPLELVNLRVAVRGPGLPVGLEPITRQSAASPVDWLAVDGCRQPVPMYQRDSLGVGQTLTGPAIISEAVATTWLDSGWRARVDKWGNLLLQRLHSGTSANA